MLVSAVIRSGTLHVLILTMGLGSATYEPNLNAAVRMDQCLNTRFPLSSLYMENTVKKKQIPDQDFNLKLTLLLPITATITCPQYANEPNPT